MKRRHVKLFFIQLLVILLVLPPGIMTAQSSVEAIGSFEREIIAEYHFDDGTTQGWFGREANLEVVDNEAHSGEYSLFVDGRTEGWNSPALDLQGMLEIGATYEIAGYMKRAEATSEEKLVMAMIDQSVGEDAQYNWINSRETSQTDWVELRGEYTITDEKEDLVLYFEIENNTENFYIDSISITKISPADDSFVPEIVAEFDFEDGTTQGWFGRGITPKVVQGNGQSGEHSIFVEGRTENWHSPALNVRELFEIGATYEITGHMKRATTTEEDGNLVMAMIDQSIGGDANYNWIDNKRVTHDNWVALSGEYSITEEKGELTLYFEIEGNTEDFYINTITITMISPPTETGDDDIIDVPVEERVAAFTDFEDGTTQGWEPREGPEELTVTTDTAKNGERSLLISNRQGSFHSAKLDFLDHMYAGHTYDISVWVKLAPGETPTSLQISRAETISGSTNYYPPVINPTEVTADEWVLLQGTYTLTGNVSDLYFYVEEPYDENQETGVSFYIDDFKAEVRVPDELEDIAPLKDVFADHFDIGAAVEPRHTAGQHGKMLEKHYNMLVAENIMKPESIQPTEGEFNWVNADAMFDYAEENGLKVRFHTLVWHSQSPSWMFLDANGDPMVVDGVVADPDNLEANKALLLQRIEDHVHAVVGRYGDRVDSWDVVNEVIVPTEEDGFRKSEYYLITGTEFIHKAFEATAEALAALGDDVHPNAKLYYNDYNTHNPQKREFIYEMVKEMQNEGIPIDGIGHQTHLNINSSIELVIASIERFTELGLDNQITELDISIYTGNNEAFFSYADIPASKHEEVAMAYGELFKQLRGVSDQVSSVVFWGIADDHTWLHGRGVANRVDAPFVFDQDLKAKEAYYTVIDDNYVAPERPSIPEPKSEIAYYGTPTINGELDDIWQIATVFETDTWVEGESGSTASVRALWDDEYLYVFAEVTDSQLSNVSNNEWEQDSVEIFVDQNNEKTNYYQLDDGQFRVNFENEVSINGFGSDTFRSATAITEEGYIVEAAIKLEAIEPVEGTVIGFDIQVNNDENGDGVRNSVVTWNDPTGESYQSTSQFGELQFVLEPETDQEKPVDDPLKPGDQERKPSTPGEEDSLVIGGEGGSERQHETEEGSKGDELPRTATNNYNMIALGSLLLLLGTTILIVFRRKNKVTIRE
ncbi:endo-1,4-beta-xylanase [Evansella cellulosilytica]|uniref:Beta-xylanase n=1 Tax=Evansella cellulosilytica (strain ATCC 21833 / DSM 2522 / FERM P-1141 / JCM 9156 / N-4) TaxID=649639 RepID=E6TXK9_EVAC2|nr:endo-1,4-beta-xylanase [Evansella cellulosilytica]ADU28823.1 LPXTG-motif cell wall anchor domain protein [Evansella cellulosilytica DSM 2522]